MDQAEGSEQCGWKNREGSKTRRQTRRSDPEFLLRVCLRDIASSRLYLTLQARARDAFHEILLGGEEEDDAGEHAPHAGGHEEVGVADAVLAFETVERQ